MPPTLTALNGDKNGTKYVLTQERVRLGRHPDCEVVIDASAVSRHHAQMTRESDGFLIEDLQSRNGTYVNGKKIEGRVPLRDNDRVKICDVLFLYRESEGADKASASSLTALVKESVDETSSTVISAIDAKQNSEMIVKVHAEAKLRAILEISAAIGKTLDLDQVFQKILDSLFTIFPHADRALIILKDAENHMTPRAVRHRRGSEDTVRFSRTIIRSAMEQKVAILSADASSDERFSMSQSIADFSIRSVMCVPLLSQDQSALGVLQIDTQSHRQKFTEDDLQILAAVGNQASISIENAQLHERTIAQARIERELDFAKSVQQSFLPRKMPTMPGYRFWAFYEAAGQVGGDYYDFIRLPSGRYAVTIGDVAGKGVPAALMMAKATSDTKVALLSQPDNVAEAMGLINNAICAAGVEDKFITTLLCVIDPQLHELTIVNAGHMSPMIRRKDGAIDEPADQTITGLPVGIVDEYVYQQVRSTLNADDVVVLFSDGINEAMNSKHQEYSIDRIRQRVRSVHLSPEKLGELIIKDVRDHVAGHRQSDDMTMVIFSRTDP